MERRIRWLGVVLVLCFLGLFVQLNNIQIVKAHALATSPSNPRVVQVERNDPRGDILSADGIVLASSIPSSGYYRYQRAYNPYTAVLFSQIVGFDSIIYGKTGIEAEYNSYLESHTRPAKTLGDLLTSRTTTGNVTLTITSTLQSQVAQAVNATNVDGGAPVAAAVVLNVKSGAVEAMYSNPPYDPTLLASPNIAVEKYTYTKLINDPAQPLLSRTFQAGFLPGSTFKTVTSAAVYDHQPALAKVDYPAVGCHLAEAAVPLAALQLRAQRSERARSVRWGAHPDPACVVRHRLRPTGHGPRGRGPHCRGAVVRVQPDSADRPARGQRLVVSRRSRERSGIQHQQAVPGLLQRSGSRTSSPRPCRWPSSPTASPTVE